MGYYGNHRSFEDLKGLTFTRVQQTSSDTIVFESDTGRVFELTHHQDCCESVYIESIVGDLSDLEGAEILMAEEVSNADGEQLDRYADSFTWTFYKLATIKGYVDIRFYGSSNGYYSEDANLYEVTQ